MSAVTNKSWLLKSAVAAVPLLIACGTASAQYRLNEHDGQALDANNRLGSGGHNSGHDLKYATPSGNDIVTGNVTGLRHFHGRIDYTDPRAFRGNVPSARNSDTLVRASGNAPTADNPNTTVQPGGRLFYGESRGVSAPSGFQQIAPGVPGYIPSAQVTQRPVGDQRLGDVSSGTFVDRPRADQLVLQGPTNQQGQQTSIVGSALLGIRPTTGEESWLLSGLNNYSLQRGGLDDAAVQRMRDELSTTVTNPNQTNQQNQTGTGQPGGTPPGPGELPNQPLNNTGPGSELPNQALNTQIATAQGSQTDQMQRQKLLLPPERQSDQYREMLKKYQQLEAERKLTPQEMAQQYNELTRLSQQQPGQPAQPGQPGAPGNAPRPQGAAPAPGAAQTPGAAQPAPGAAQTTPGAAQPGAAPGAVRPGAQPAAKTVKKPEPVKVQSMAAGMQAKGLSEVMKQAEDLMRQGKYNAALDKYDAAQQAAPNNPMVSLGRAIAELGGSFYARAEGHLRDAFTQNPALLVGQYDLRNLLGEERLQGLVKDLRALAEREKRDPRPVFLLSFIAYNTGQEQAAEGYLSLAEKRAGGRDPFFQTLRNNWAIPEKQGEAAPTTLPNK